MDSLTERSASRMQRLVEASRRGDLQEITALLRGIPEGFPLGKNGELALQEIVRHGHLGLIDIFIKSGVSPLATDSSGMAPLHIAVMNRHEHVVRHLVNNVPEVKHNINQVCGDGKTAYQLAKMKEFDSLAIMLVEMGAEPRSDGMSRNASTPTLSSGEVCDYVPRIYQRATSMDESIVALQKQMQDMMLSIQKSFSDMNTAISGIGKQGQDTTKQLAELKAKMQQVEDNIVGETKAINSGMDTLRTRTEELRTTFHQAEEYNDVLYFHVFRVIAKTVGLKRNTWMELCGTLFAGYPKPLVEEIVKEVHLNHTSEEDMAYEILTKWKLYKQHSPDKMGTLKDAIQSTSRIEHLLPDIDDVINKHNRTAVKKAKDVLSDRFLLEVAGKMWEGDYALIGTALGTSAVRLDQLRHDNSRDSRNRNFTMLVQWRDRQNGSKLTIQSQLIEALKASGRQDLAAQVAS